MTHHHRHGGGFAPNLQRRLEVGDIVGRCQDDRLRTGDVGLGPHRRKAEVASDDAGTGCHGPLEPVGVCMGVGNHRHCGAGSPQSLHDIEP